MLFAKYLLPHLHHYHLQLLGFLPPTAVYVYELQLVGNIHSCSWTALEYRIDVREKCPPEHIILRFGFPVERQAKYVLCACTSQCSIGDHGEGPCMDQWMNRVKFVCFVKVNERVRANFDDHFQELLHVPETLRRPKPVQEVLGRAERF